MKITSVNISRLSEDYLVSVINNLPESDPMFILIDAELDRRGTIHLLTLEAQHQSDLEKLIQFQKLELEVHKIFEGFRGSKTLMLIEKLGQDYIDDYTVCPDSFKVTSHVAHLCKNETPGTWSFDNIESANCKKATLIYYRIYNKYMRNVSVETLTFLNKALLGGF